MVGFDDAAMMGLGAINAGAQIFGQRQQARSQRKLQVLGQQEAQRHHVEDLTENQLGQEQTNRQAGYDQMASREGENERGLLNSSENDYQSGKIEQQRQLRMDALQRQRTMMNADWNTQVQSWKIQRKMQKTSQVMNMISTALLQGGSGAANAIEGGGISQV